MGPTCGPPLPLKPGTVQGRPHMHSGGARSWVISPSSPSPSAHCHVALEKPAGRGQLETLAIGTAADPAKAGTFSYSENFPQF